MENQILQQIEAYLNYKISKEEYTRIIEEYFDLHGDELMSRNPLFYQTFMDWIPDICFFYVYEPDTEYYKERDFYRNMESVYTELLKVK